MLNVAPREMHVIVRKGAFEDTRMFNTRTSRTMTSADIRRADDCDAHLCAGGGREVEQVREGVNHDGNGKRQDITKKRCEKVALS